MHALNVPAEQVVCCVDPAGQKAPFPQNACVVELLQKLPTTQAGHAELTPNPVEYVPEPHGVHALDRDAPAVTEYVPARHCVHVLATAKPTPVENVPAPQDVQTVAPAAGL